MTYKQKEKNRTNKSPLQVLFLLWSSSSWTVTNCVDCVLSVNLKVTSRLICLSHSPLIPRCSLLLAFHMVINQISHFLTYKLRSSHLLSKPRPFYTSLSRALLARTWILIQYDPVGKKYELWSRSSVYVIVPTTGTCVHACSDCVLLAGVDSSWPNLHYIKVINLFLFLEQWNSLSNPGAVSTAEPFASLQSRTLLQ